MEHIRNITKALLRAIAGRLNEEAWRNNQARVTDTKIANILHLTKTTYSRLSTGVQTPTSEVYQRIIDMAKTVLGGRITTEIIETYNIKTDTLTWNRENTQ